MDPSVQYIHCDVFAPQAFSGNSLAVFLQDDELSAAQMLAITLEMRHFESIFIVPPADGTRVCARIFDLVGELPFAGHPIIGAACVLHSLDNNQAGNSREWIFHLPGKSAAVKTQAGKSRYRGTMDQGRPEFLGTLPANRRAEFARSFNLDVDALSPHLPLDVVSTGLKYLIIPVRYGLATARIVDPDLTARLNDIGADFAYLFDVERFEGRHWNNDGIIEDVATGSAAGTVGAYALRHALIEAGKPMILQQGRYAGRPSEISVRAFGSPADVERIEIAGDVSIVAHGTLRTVPA